MSENDATNLKREGILLVNKPTGKTSFSLVTQLRRLLLVKTIGHAGTLDPFATGLMVMLIGRKYTRQSNTFLNTEKEYEATLRLGEVTDTYDCDGKVLSRSEQIPSDQELTDCLLHFQGEIAQTPPMFSAKKYQGKRLYELARKGIVVTRAPVIVSVELRLIAYDYPFVKLWVRCSKGTYIRSLAFDIGNRLGCGAHLSSLCRLQCGVFSHKNAIDGSLLFHSDLDRKWLCRQLSK